MTDRLTREDVEKLRKIVEDAYHEGYSDGYYTDYPQKDIARNWECSMAHAALQEK